MLLMNTQRTLEVTRWTLALAGLSGIVLVYHRWFHVNPTTVALTLLLLILLLAAEWGLRYAVAVSIAATACYNYYFLPPLGTFTIADPQNWLALFAFLATAIIASRLAQRARDEALQARARQGELEILFSLSRELLQFESVSALLSSIPAAVASVTNAKSCALFLIDGDRLYQAGDHGLTDIELPHLHQLTGSLSAVNVENDEVQIPIRSGVRSKGLLLLKDAILSAETAEAIGGLVMVSIDRVQALENVSRGEAAKESERLRSLMIDSVTHQLRTPLTSIKGAATSLLHSDQSPEERREMLTIIDEESDRLNTLVAEAVEMAQLDAQQVQLHLETVKISGLIEEARAKCSWVEEEHQLNVRVADGLQVRVDPNLTETVLCNLLENAAKYSAAGTPITVTAESENGAASISVADRGPGIDASEQTLIFERFYRGRSRETGTWGTGMGLAISRAIVEAHGGEIKVTSRLGEGSVFTVCIPNSNGS